MNTLLTGIEINYIEMSGKKQMSIEEKTNIKELIEQVIEYRTMHGLSQRKFANRAGLSKSFIVKFESGQCKAPKPMSLRQIKYVLSGGVVEKLGCGETDTAVCPVCQKKIRNNKNEV